MIIRGFFYLALLWFGKRYSQKFSLFTQKPYHCSHVPNPQSRQSAKVFSPVVGIGTPPTPHPLVPGGGANSLAREEVGESQFRRGDIHCGTLYLCVLCDLALYLKKDLRLVKANSRIFAQAGFSRIFCVHLCQSSSLQHIDFTENIKGTVKQDGSGRK